MSRKRDDAVLSSTFGTEAGAAAAYPEAVELGGVPCVEVLVEGRRVCKQVVRVGHLAHVPTVELPVERHRAAE